MFWNKTSLVHDDKKEIRQTIIVLKQIAENLQATANEFETYLNKFKELKDEHDNEKQSSKGGSR